MIKSILFSLAYAVKSFFTYLIFFGNPPKMVRHEKSDETPDQYYDPCPWCGADYECDCMDRIVCKKAGETGHLMCGTLICGCPRFTGCDRACEKGLEN